MSAVQAIKKIDRINASAERSIAMHIARVGERAKAAVDAVMAQLDEAERAAVKRYFNVPVQGEP